MKTNLNVKNMIIELITYSAGNQDAFNKIWDAYYRMYTLGFITRTEWVRFYDKCKGYYWEGNELRDSEQKDKKIAYMNPDNLLVTIL